MKPTAIAQSLGLFAALFCYRLGAQSTGAQRQSDLSGSCKAAAFLILEQGKLAGVNWVEYRGNQVHTKTILTQSRVIDATIDLRPDQTASHASVVLMNAGEKSEAPKVRDLGEGAIYLSDFIVSSVEQAVARARVLNQPVSHVLATSLYRDSSTDVLVERVDATDWTVAFRNKNYRVLTDDHGCMLAATLPEYGVVIERRADFSPSRYPLWSADASPPDAAYQAVPMKIQASQGFLLAGTLTIPTLRKPAPAAVLITGLAPSGRNGGSPPWMPLRDISDSLTRAGIAVLRVDDRGVGKSTGDHASSTTYDEETDVRTEVAWLRAQPAIDPKRIALVGYSEGGLIAMMVASNDPAIAAIITLAGPGTPGDQLAREQIEQAVSHDLTISPEKRSAEIQKELAEPLTPRERVVLTIDPLRYASLVHCPALILQGGADITVPIRSAEKIASSIRQNGNRDVTVQIIPGVSHSLLPDPIGPGSGWLYLPAFVTSPPLLDLMANWAARHLLH